jgi:hypothetical protein
MIHYGHKGIIPFRHREFNNEVHHNHFERQCSFLCSDWVNRRIVLPGDWFVCLANCTSFDVILYEPSTSGPPILLYECIVCLAYSGWAAVVESWFNSTRALCNRSSGGTTSAAPLHQCPLAFCCSLWVFSQLCNSSA